MYWLRRGWAELRNEVFVLPSRTLVLAWVVALLALPVVYGDPYVMRIVTMTCIFAIFAASWDLLAGYTGQVNFGHALFFGAGAYTSALLSLKLGLSPWATIWAGAAVALFVGFVVGYLCLRLRGSYALIGYDFVGNGEQTNNRDGNPDTQDVGGAKDVWIGATAALAVIY